MTHEPCVSRGDCYHSRGGRIGGRKAVESGQLARIRELPQTKAARRENGRRNVKSGQLAKARKRAYAVLAARPEIRREVGRKNVESGHLQRISSLGGRIQGRKSVESGQLARINELPQSKAAQREVGRKVGRKNVESGQLARIRKLPQTKVAQREAGRKVGRVQGRKAVESGQLARISRGVPSTADGILFRSQTEASFYCVVKELGGEPVYEPGFIKLPNGTSYMPDFVLGKSVLGILDGIPIELKPARNASYYNGNSEKAIRAGATVVYWDELVEGSF